MSPSRSYNTGLEISKSFLSPLYPPFDPGLLTYFKN